MTPSVKDVWYGRERTLGRVRQHSNWLRYTGLAQVGQQYRYSEQRIVAGAPLYALGDFTTHSGVDPSIDRPGEIAALLRIWKKDREQPLQRFDENKDGEIDLKEWEQARQAAEIAVEENYK